MEPGLQQRAAVSDALWQAARQLCEAVRPLRFGPPVAFVYNPLDYAAQSYRAYLARWARGTCRVLFLGMNPGPWGMAQVGVPFGDIMHVRDWLGICEPVGRPPAEHPAKPVRGFACPRSEVSGRRLWGLFADRFGRPGGFFRDHFVLNYCPLLFLDERGRNLTPDKLPGADRNVLDRVCDRHLQQALAALQPQWLVGIGNYAAAKAERLVAGTACRPAVVLHPSPANPRANRGWAAAARVQLEAQGLWKPGPIAKPL